VREIWLHASALLRAAKLNAFGEIEADICADRGLLWLAWNGRTADSAAAAILISSEIGKIFIITLCGGHQRKALASAAWPDRKLRRV
jgi:hypothetical protein